jgi:hypothetical protein
MSNQLNEHPLFGEVISVYTRAQALADGVLIDAGAMVHECGFRWPVALTAAAWNDCVAWSESDNERQIHQDPSGRLWDVLYMAAYAARNPADAVSQRLFELYRVPRDGHSTEAETTRPKLVVGPGDGGEPVITILLPNED